MDYVIAEISGKQYKLEPNKTILVDSVLNQENKTVKIDKILMHKSDAGIRVGDPYLTDVSVSADVLGEEKAKKIAVLRFRAKSHYHKSRGHRQTYFRLKVISIDAQSSSKNKA